MIVLQLILIASASFSKLIIVRFWGELFIEEERFRSAIQAINERSRIHLNICQPLLERVGIVEGGEYTAEQIQAALGHRLVLQLKRATDAVVQHVDKTVESSLAMGAKLYTVQKNLRAYPNRPDRL
jgi:HEAT repeat protein